MYDYVCMYVYLDIWIFGDILNHREMTWGYQINHDEDNMCLFFFSIAHFGWDRGPAPTKPQKDGPNCVIGWFAEMGVLRVPQASSCKETIHFWVPAF